jgi:hypothetical protein
VVSADSGLLGAIFLSGSFRVSGLFVAALPLGVAAILTGIAALLWRPPSSHPLGTRWRALAILGLTIGIVVSAAFLAVFIDQAATFVPET